MSGAGIQGKVAYVRERRLGTELARDHVAGEDVLEVEDVTELPAPGGDVSLGIAKYAYTRDDVGDQGVDELELSDTPDLDVGTITIDPPLAVDHEDGDRLFISPAVFVRSAGVFLEEQEEVVPARVDWSLYGNVDQLPTGTREDPEDAETVTLTQEDDELVIRDVVGEQGQGLSRGYAEVEGPFDVTETLPDPKVLAALTLEIPTTAHRLLVWYSALYDVDDGTVANLHLDDAGFDFDPGVFPLVTYYGDSMIPGPNRVMSMVPAFSLAGATTTIAGESSGSWEASSLPAPILPYALEEPSPGLHIFRLCASRFSGPGTVTVSDVKFWATVI